MEKEIKKILGKSQAVSLRTFEAQGKKNVFKNVKNIVNIIEGYKSVAG